MLEKFCHRAFYNREKQRVEMHLVSLRKQVVTCSELSAARPPCGCALRRSLFRRFCRAISFSY